MEIEGIDGANDDRFWRRWKHSIDVWRFLEESECECECHESKREKNINPKHKKKARNETNCIYISRFQISAFLG